ncbi:hypothetical protein TrVGV298_012220 [Trichoderma virens]|nr:hypothetical protein TrVGV298_012220 [Trichoderma virens]UKZ84035.1 hypothetical protein TrVFT333_011851 [Trichoderma virens FT-333]
MTSQSEYQSFSPATGKHLMTFSETTDEEIRSALSIDAWCGKTVQERREELAQLITLEVGKLIAESRFEVKFCIHTFEYFAVNAERFLQPTTVTSNPGCEVWTEPLGVILAIEPWNFPLLQLARVAAPHIMAGNVLIALFRDAGVPDGVYTNVFATVPQLHNLVEDFRIRGITLTGTVAGRMFNTGQGCAASKRIIVIGKDREQEVLNGMKDALADLKPGDPLNPKTNLGAIFSERGLLGLLSQIESAKAAGANVILGGKRSEHPGFYLEPTILTNIAPENPIAQQETFGPIAAIYGIDTEEQAIKLANSTDYGLGASIIGADPLHAKKVAAQIEAGMVFIDSPAYSSPDLPFGGIKNSGFGKELSDIGFGEFTNKKLVRVSYT